MESERLHQIEELYHAALDRPQDGRVAFLDQACGEDRDLHRQVESLLEQESSLGRFLERPALEVAARALALDQRAADQAEPGSSLIGQTISHYRIARELGRGGMGVVWLATRADGSLKRQVALKFPLLYLDSQTLANRFTRERDILAKLEDARIARL